MKHSRAFCIPYHPTLGVVPFKTMILSGLWMALWYGLWLWLQEEYGTNHAYPWACALVGFIPLLLWSVMDYRIGLLLTVIATPLLQAPPIPHSFLAGFGDWLAVASLLGYGWRNPHPRDWLKLWQRSYRWLVAIIAAAVISLAVVFPNEEMERLKIGIAEVAGILLNIGVLVLLVHELSRRDDFKALLKAAVTACMVALLFSIAAAGMSAVCTGGYYGGRTWLTVNQSVGATFGNPNYHAAYLLTLLPLMLWLYIRQQGKSLPHFLMAMVVLGFIFLVQASISRAAILVLVLVLPGWLIISRFKRGTRVLSVLMLLMVPLTYAVWWYPACTCPDIGPSFCPFRLENGGLGGLTTKQELLRTPKAEGSWGDYTRRQLVENAVTLWQRHPVTGVGTGLMAYYSQASSYHNRAHVMILTIAAEQGIVGVIAWGGFVIALLMILWRHRPQKFAHDDPFWYLALAVMTTLLLSLFIDFYRMLWIWHVAALVIAWPRLALHEKTP